MFVVVCKANQRENSVGDKKNSSWNAAQFATGCIHRLRGRQTELCIGRLGTPHLLNSCFPRQETEQRLGHKGPTQPHRVSRCRRSHGTNSRAYP